MCFHKCKEELLVYIGEISFDVTNDWWFVGGESGVSGFVQVQKSRHTYSAMPSPSCLLDIQTHNIRIYVPTMTISHSLEILPM